MHLRLPIPVRGRGGTAVSRGEHGASRPLTTALLTLFLLFGCFAPAAAFPLLGPSRLAISGLDTRTFPVLSFNLELYDADEQLVTDLKPAQLTIYEDRIPLQPQALELIPRGLQFTLAINASPALAAEVNGTQQLSAARRILMDWAEARRPEFGDFSLAGNTGLQLIRSRTPREWVAALDAYRPDLAKAQPGLFALTTALDLAAESVPSAVEDGQKSLFKPAVLFLTAPLGQSEIAGLGNQAARAAQAGIPVFVWVVVADPNNLPATPIPGLAELQALADTTGGKLALVSAAAGFPDLDAWLSPLEQIYRVAYNSAIRGGGDHTLSVAISRPDLALTSARDLRFNLDILAPNPIFVDPPAVIERTWSSGGVLQPASEEIQILVEFPDGFRRPLRLARLLVNGETVAENLSSPFERFTWTLEDLSEPATANLRVEVEDGIGLTGRTIDHPVEILVPARPQQGLLARITPQGLIAIGAVLLAGAVLTVLVVGETRQHARRGRAPGRRKNDPVTQPIQIAQEPLSRPRGEKTPRSVRRAAAPSPSWPRGAVQPLAPARLIRLAENEAPIQGGQVPVNRPELTFGSDPRKAIVPLADPSVCALHARLVRTQQGAFILTDEGSIAGTWVNYTPVGPAGRRLEHGDLVHFGRVVYRFELVEPPLRPDPVIRLVDEGP